MDKKRSRLERSNNDDDESVHWEALAGNSDKDNSDVEPETDAFDNLLALWDPDERDQDGAIVINDEDMVQAARERGQEEEDAFDADNVVSQDMNIDGIDDVVQIPGDEESETDDDDDDEHDAVPVNNAVSPQGDLITSVVRNT